MEDQSSKQKKERDVQYGKVRGRGEQATDTPAMLCAHTRSQNLNVAW